ncbi:hypothetical protein FIBSPDRAFT_1042284 [Athelia psychrophila]|uniref:BTB domain-containing protein n=1 Tax=Athelia psychrophila TaxID=1759441 RepID=A0A166MQV2_9AGAM|nr:hypothetical protein FIBSPDRAFT_1042284 [Fibularhizoctonia sp. CBS 109695]
MSFGEKPSPTASIAAILSAYPFSVGLLREFLQNSDDAKASEQIFVLDSRSHPNSKLFHPELAETQGPALLACNDALFEESDWEAVQRPNESSKMADPNKIGKYGVGFRACYHVTDNPQILSDSSLAIFDPHCNFTKTGGERFDFVEKSSRYEDQLSGFDFFLEGDHTKPYQKTIIRLPLRTIAGAMISRIKGEVVEPSKIRTIFQSFIEEELGIVLLFLNSVTSIKIYEVDDNGTTCLAEAKALKRHSEVSQELNVESISTYILDVKFTRGDRAECQPWRIFNASFPRIDAAKQLSKRLGYDVAAALKKQKLHPNVAFAVPLDLDYLKQNKGRLYIFLPLPMSTGFPCHVHALFSLAPDRQHLRNSEETGIVGVDSVHVEWNRLLFDTFIPYAWASMLLVLLREDQFIDVFQACPPPQPEKQGGDAGYWKNLPCDLIKTIVEKNLAVWPIIPYTSNPSFSGLQSLLVAEESGNKEMLAVLAMAGVKVTQPSTYLKALLEKSGVTFTPLEPGTTRDTLLTNSVALSHMQSDVSAIKRIRSYLLTTGNIGLLVGLPLVRQANGEFTSLESHQPSKHNHVLLDGASLNVFRDCDKDAIDLTQFSPREAELFLSAGPTTVNVATLDVKCILMYLKCAFANFMVVIDGAATGTLSEDFIRWLISFWEWLGEWDLRSQLYQLIGTLPLIPTLRNSLLPVMQGVMGDAPPNVSVFEDLESLGISFIHTGMSKLARIPLVEQGLMKSVKNGVHILEQLSPILVYRIRSETTESLRTYMLTVLAGSVRLGPLTVEQARTLRALPMFPILTTRPDATTALTTIGAIDGIANIISVNKTSLLPVIPNTAYIEGCDMLLDILPDIFEKNNLVKMLALAVHHIGTQSKHLQCTILNHMVNHRDDITIGQKKKLARAPFVTVGIPTSGELRAAKDLFDPDCAVANLFSKHDFHIPSTSSKEDKVTVYGLKTLGLFRTTLSKEAIEERITHLAQSYREKESHRLALNLLQIIVDQNIDVRDVSNLRSSRWLPVAQESHTGGLCTSEECRHRDAHAAALFDQVLPSLQVKHLTESFMVALKWRAPLDLNIIITQLDHVIKQGPSESSFKKLRAIIIELGERVDKLTDYDVERLQDLTSGRSWIPISKVFLSTTGRAVLSSRGSILPRGFHKIPEILSEDGGTRRFICLMGCTERPTVDALLEELHSLQDLAVSEDRTSAAIDLLIYLADMEPVIENHLPTLIPTAEGALCAISTVYYNDLQRHTVSSMPRLPEGSYLAHPLVRYELAKQLQMTFLGHRETQFKALLKTSRDMGESLTNRIKGVLLQYSVQQVFPEFIANAAEAGAKHFAIMVDDWSAPSISVLSPPFGKLQSHSSLIVYNDSVFSEDDFDGIMNLGRGGKGDRTDTMGRFGLGALTMFHFTDAAMIVSGKHVMFLDPSRTHLPIQNQVSAWMSLSDVKHCYPDHLTSIDGLYGFSLDSDHFQGTLFRLPLRKTRSPLSEQPLSTSELHDLIKTDYWDIAAQTLMFTNVDLIEAHHRDKQGKMHDLWFVKTKRGPEAHQEGHFTTHSFNIDASSYREGEHGEWHIFTCETKDKLSSKFQHLSTKHRLRHPIKIAFAAGPQPSPSQGKFFATMPLPGASGLPVHFHAPFILAPDRRSTRLDGVEAKYNAWLLGTLAPPLYVYLLERLFHQRPNQLKDRWLWWPLINPLDPLTSSLYATHISKTSRAICVSTTSEIISPSQATFFVDATLAEVRLLISIETSNLVEIPAAIQAALGSGIRSLDPAFVKKAISTDAEKVKASFARKTKQHVTVQDIQDVVRFLCTKKDMTLQGLPLLPLANSTLAAFQKALNYAPHSAPYYAWDSFSQACSLFPSHRMVHPEFSIIELGKSYNVSRLDGVAVQSLVSDRVKKSETLENCDEDYGVWVASFWQGYERMKIKEEDIEMFPLVLTTTAGSYVSLKNCKTNTVLVLAATQLRSILECLGVTTIALELCPPALQEILKSGIYTQATVWNVIRFFQSMPASNISLTFTRLNAGDRAFLVGWLTTRLVEPLPEDLKDTANHLPIWALLGDGNDFVAASRADMLSSDATIFAADILHFSPAPLKQRLVAYSATLSYVFSKMGLTQQRLWSELGLKENRVLQPLDTAPYRRALVAVLESNQWEPNAPLVVPDGHNMLVKVRDLYSRSQPLFRSTFETCPDMLVHQDILDLEPRLRRYGLHMDMTFASFLVCVSTIHNEAPDSARRIERAAGLYRWYSETFPVQAEGQQWSQLNHFRFVPATASQRAAPYPSAYLNDNIRDRDLVSPQEVLLPVHEAIAWTQKALFNPSDRLTIANQLIGVPTPIEVYMHLRVLALKIAPNYPPTPQLISDIRATYSFLDKHTGDAEFRGALATHRNDALFLNVDNTKVGSWTWRSAAELYICTGLIKDIPNNNYWVVRKFLNNFSNLLHLAKVGEIKAAKAQVMPNSASKAELDSIVGAFNDMRVKTELTDVAFVAGDDDSEDRMQFHGHRDFLVSRSQFFHGLFCGSFEEAKPANEPFIVEDCGVDCLREILDYLYTWKIPEAEDEDALLEILKLADYWNIPILFETMQIRIINLGLISVDTYSTLREKADLYHAVILQEACKVFETENMHEIKMFHDRQIVI